MRELATVWWRAASLVTITAFNVTLVTHGHYVGAFFSGGLLSYVWWGNTRRANRTDSWAAQCCYALGAGCGTATGMFIGRLFG